MAKGVAGDNGNGVRIGLGKPVPPESQISHLKSQTDKPPPGEAINKGAKPPTMNGGDPGTPTKNPAIDYGQERIVTVDVPLRMIAGVYASNRVDVHLSPRQAMAFRALYDAVIFRRERLANGAYVGNQQVDAIRWLLDKIADAAGF